MNVSKKDLLKDMEKASEFDQSMLFKKIYGGVRIPEAERSEGLEPAAGLTGAPATVASIREA